MSMKHAIFVPFWALLLVILAACAAMGVESPQTFNEKLAVGISSVTAARQTAVMLLQGGKISLEDAMNVQQQADNVRAGLEVARTMGRSDPAAAESKLAASQAILKALQAYLLAKEAKK